MKATDDAALRRPIGWWLAEAESRIEAAFARALAGTGFDRRSWQVLATLAREPVPRAELLASLEAFTHTGRSVVEDLAGRGLVSEDGGLLRLTHAGRRLEEDLAARVERVRSQVRDALPAGEYAALVRSLARLAHALDDDARGDGAAPAVLAELPLDPPVVLRRAVAADLPAIVALLADDQLGATRDGGDLAPYAAALAALDADPAHLLVVAEGPGGGVVGTFQLSFLPGLARRGSVRAQIEAVRVAAGHRGAGVGAAMIGWAVDEARRRGCTLVQLTTDKRRADARRFYERLGFTASHEGMKLLL